MLESPDMIDTDTRQSGYVISKTVQPVYAPAADLYPKQYLKVRRNLAVTRPNYEVPISPSTAHALAL